MFQDHPRFPQETESLHFSMLNEAQKLQFSKTIYSICQTVIELNKQYLEQPSSKILISWPLLMNYKIYLRPFFLI